MKQNEKIIYLIIAAVILVVISAFFRPTVVATAKPVFEFTEETALKTHISESECQIDGSAKLTNLGDSVEKVIIRAEIRSIDKRIMGVDLIPVGEIHKDQFRIVEFNMKAELDCNNVSGIHLEVNSFE